MSVCVYPLLFEVLRQAVQHLHQAMQVVRYQDAAYISIFSGGVVHVIRAFLIHTHNSFYTTRAKMSFVLVFCLFFIYLVGDANSRLCICMNVLVLHFYCCSDLQLHSCFSHLLAFGPYQQWCCDFFFFTRFSTQFVMNQFLYKSTSHGHFDNASRSYDVKHLLFTTS